jgi:peroxiredoxin
LRSFRPKNKQGSERLDGLDAVMLGVSPDSLKSHKNFKKKFNLRYALAVVSVRAHLELAAIRECLCIRPTS